jgi:hypothetical protein
MPLNFELSSSSIVLVGSFNPTIFQPQWFARHGLISDPEAENATVKLIAPQVSQFETERFVILVLQERFTAASKPSADPAPLRDLVLGTFFILEHTPVTAMGLNRQMHVAMRGEDDWHRLGDRLAPKEGWRGILNGRPGMLSLSITVQREAPPGAVFNVTVQPSLRVKHGAYFETNEHYTGPQDQSLQGLMKVLGQRWEDVPNYASRVVEHILDWARSEG